jgi:hypothetical protein
MAWDIEGRRIDRFSPGVDNNNALLAADADSWAKVAAKCGLDVVQVTANPSDVN